MDSHANSDLFTDWHDFVEEIVQIAAETGIVDPFVTSQHFLELIRRQVVYSTGESEQDGITELFFLLVRH